MPRRSSSTLIALVALALAVPSSRSSALNAAQVGDVAPTGSPDGRVDAADVDLALKAAAGDATLDDAGIERADAAPVTPLSPATDHPQLVRPNPNPVGPVDVGDAVVLARRAAGIIAFAQVNQPPVVTLSGDGAIVSVASYVVSGTLADDNPIAAGQVALSVDGASAGDAALLTATPSSTSGTFSATVTLVEGKNEIVATPRDAEGRLGASVTIAVTLDVTPPEATIDSPDDGFITNQGTVELSGTASDQSGVTVSIGAVNGVLLPPDLWGATVPLVAEDENLLQVDVKDGATPPNVTSLERLVIHDTTAPGLTIDTPPAAVSTHTFAATGTVSDKWGVQSVVVGDTDAVITWDAATHSGTWLAAVPVEAGANSYPVVALDVAGNRTSASPIEITGDFDPPTVTLVSPAFVGATPTDLKLAYSEPVFVEQIGATTFSPPLRVDGGSQTLSTPLQEGANELTVKVEDLAGNVTTKVVTVTLDTRPPVVKITKVSNAAFSFLPVGGLDGVVTNAPSLVVEGTVTDGIGVAGVKVNGFAATVDDDAGTFTVSGVPLVPRANTITATATDLSGNAATSTVGVKRDAEGPVVALDFARASYVSAIDPAAPAFTALPANARLHTSPTDIVVHGTATDPNFTGTVSAVAVTLDGVALPVTGSAPFSSFSFTLPVAVLHTAGLHLVQTTSTDALGNQTVDVQSFLAGQWVAPNATITNAIGAVAGPDALSAIGSLLSSEVAGMNGDIPDSSTSVAGVTLTIYGIAFCEPAGNPSVPPYSCTPSVKVTLTLEADGHVGIAIHIPLLYAGLGTSTSFPLSLACGSSSKGYLTASPADISLEADFVNTPSGVTLQAVGGTTAVTIGSLGVHSGNGCVDGAANLLGSYFTSLVEGQFANEIPTLLSSVDTLLASPQLVDANTGRGVWIARASNDASALHFWLDAHGNPCPSASAKTNVTDKTTGALKPCPADSPRLAPGSYAATPNPDASTLPNLDLVAPDGSTVSAEVGANDDFVNYMVHEQWAMGTFDLSIDQDTLGADSSITLDTSALSLFMADLKRADVVAKIPLGSKVAIQVTPPLPPVLTGRQTTAPFYDLAMGDMTWRFVADADGNPANGYEAELFTASVSLKAPAQLSVVPAPNDNSDDVLRIALGTPEISTDITDNPLVLNEASVRSAIQTLVQVALPQLTGGLTDVSLPTNTARFEAARNEAPKQDFLVLSGALLQTITVTSPAADAVVTTNPLVVQGTVAGLVNSSASSVAVWLPGDTSGRGATITSRPDANSLAFTASLPVGALQTGENVTRVVATDSNGKKAMVKLTLTRTASGVKAGAASGCGGCDGAGGANPLGFLVALGLLAGLGLRKRSRGAATLHSTALPLVIPMLVATLAGGLSECGSCNGKPAAPALVFHGPAVAKDPVFILSTLQVGDATQGFNVDGDSPNGDADPDNAIASLGPLANSSLTDALGKGSLLLLVQLAGIDHLPKAGESGAVDAVAYLGVDLDADPTDNFSGSAKFAKDPASFDQAGKPLIVFHGVKLTGNADGTVAMSGGPSSFRLAVPIQGSTLTLGIDPTYIQATLGLSPLRADGIEAKDGLLGGVIPAAPLANPIPGLDLAPLSILAAQVDVDLNGDGVLDHTATADNKDGLSAGIVFTGVPAYLTDDHVNRVPVLALDALPASVSVPYATVSGTVDDPDGDCTKTTVTVQVNGGEPSAAEVTRAAKACAVSASVELAVGANTVDVVATDSAGGTAKAELTTTFDDVTPPTVTLTGPLDHVTTPTQNVTGIALDDAGIAAVQLDVGGTPVVVPGSALGADGSFSVEVQLPAYGSNVVTAIARDLAGNPSAPATLDVVLDDVFSPTVTFTSASSATAHVDGDGPWTLPDGTVQVDGTLADNAGVAGLDATSSMDGGTPSPVTVDPDTGAFELSFTSGLGTVGLHLVAQDAAGNRTVVDRALTIADETPPVIVLTSPDALVRALGQELVLQVTDDWAAADALVVTASLGGGAPTTVPYDAATATFRMPLGLVVGANALVITATDPAGNVSHLEGDIELVDDVPPALTVTSPDDGSTTLETVAHVAGVATDDIGPVKVTVDAGGDATPATLGADGSFTVDLPLAMGPNVVTVTAVDAGGNTTQVARRVEREDPNAVATLDLVADPTAVAIGNDTRVAATATLTRLAGGPVPDGTLVQFAATPPGLGTLEATTVATVGGVAVATFDSGRVPGLVTLAASAEGQADTASVTIATPTAVAADVCLAETKTLAGVSLTSILSPDATAKIEAPEAGSVTTLGPAEEFHVYNRAALPTTVLVAGTQNITGTGDGSPIARVTWPLDSGTVTTDDFTLSNARVSNELGVTSDGSGLLYVCAVNHLLGVLPPRVTLALLPPTTQVATLTVSGTVESSDLAGCTAMLELNGVATPLDVSTGTFSQTITLAPGANDVRVVVTDSGGRQGSDERQVVFNAPNTPPVIAITSPGAAVTSATGVVVSGTVSDADDGLTGLKVTVRVGTNPAVAAAVDAGAGTWRATVDLGPGTNTITATATDARGASTIATQSTQVVAPVPPPQVTLTAPADGFVSTTDTVLLAGRVDDGGNPATLQVAMTVNGESQPVTFSPFTRALSATVTLDAGINVVVVTATDITGDSGLATVRVDYEAPDAPPKITITSPAANTTWASSTVTVTGTVKDDHPLGELQSVTVNGVAATVDTSAGTWSATVAVTPGSHTLSATATDGKGQTANATVTIAVIEPVVVVNHLQIGGPSDGFNVDSTPPTAYSDAAPDNALSGLASVANGPLADQIAGTNGKPLILLFEMVGMNQVPTPGQSATVTMNGYVGVDPDGDASNNFTGSATFQIDPSSYDASGNPLIQFKNVVVTNNFGSLSFNTFPANPAHFQLSVDSTTPPLVLKTDPAYVSATVGVQADGLHFSPALLGGVVPASTLAININVGTLSIVPLQLLLSSDPANPVPDVDLNGDGQLDDTDATASNRDGVSVGIVFSAVPAHLQR